jgi:hypothetical protein
MPKEKKRLSKNAKAALKILEESKLLSITKAATDSKTDQTFKPTNAPVKTSAPNKMRPDKKRG